MALAIAAPSRPRSAPPSLARSPNPRLDEIARGSRAPAWTSPSTAARRSTPHIRSSALSRTSARFAVSNVTRWRPNQILFHSSQVAGRPSRAASSSARIHTALGTRAPRVAPSSRGALATPSDRHRPSRRSSCPSPRLSRTVTDVTIVTIFPPPDLRALGHVASRRRSWRARGAPCSRWRFLPRGRHRGARVARRSGRGVDDGRGGRARVTLRTHESSRGGKEHFRIRRSQRRDHKLTC